MVHSAEWTEPYWTKALREAERELEATTKPSAVKVAAKKLQRAKAELKALEAEPAERLKRAGGKRPLARR